MMVPAVLRKLHETLLPPEADVGPAAYAWLLYLVFLYINFFFKAPTSARKIASRRIALLGRKAGFDGF